MMRPLRSPFVFALLAAASLLAGTSVQAQLFGDATNKPAWKEGDVPAPPSFTLNKLLKVETSSASSLESGIDPTTISVGTDGVVRYVAVARNATASNISYEGIRCAAGEHRVYARYFEGDGWQTSDSGWHALISNRTPLHARSLARGGVCAGSTPNSSPAQIVRELRNPSIYQTP